MKIAELLTPIQEDWGTSDWYPVMKGIKAALAAGTSLKDAAKDEASRYYKDMGYDTEEEAADRIIYMFKLRNPDLKLDEGMWVIKNKDGIEKRFKDDKSAAAIAWKTSSKPKKPAKYSYDWWVEQDGIKPWDRIEYVDNLYASIKREIGREPDDWTLGAKYEKNVDGVPVAARKVRLMYVYTDQDDLGLAKGDTVEDSQVIGIHRDHKNPEKFVFDGYK